MKDKITKRKVEAMPTPTEGQRERLWDTELKGFGVVAYPTGAKVFVCRYTVQGRPRQATIGEFGSPWTVQQARDRALEIMDGAIRGRDPLDEAAERRKMPTFGAWAARYMEAAALRKKASSLLSDKIYLMDLAKRWHQRPLDSITTDDVTKLFETAARDRGRTSANRALASWRACFADAWRREIINVNPCARVRPLQENPPRERVLSQAELERFFAAVEAVKDPHIQAAFRILIGTGCRRSELLNTKWADLDLDAGVWRLLSTKAKRPQRIPLTPDLVEMLRALPRIGAYVIPGRFMDKPRHDFKKPWENLCKAADLDGVHIHDLRRTYGLLAAQKVGIRGASRLLRHSRIDVTSKVYAPFDLSEAHSAASMVAQVLPFKRVAKG